MRLIFFVIIFFSYCSSLKSQTIATFECNIPGLNNQTGKGLVYMDEYRRGFLRLAWYDSIRKENVITDFDLLSAYSRETTATGFQNNLEETETILFCRAIPSKNIQGKRKFPAKDFHIWFNKGNGTGDQFKIYTGKIPDYGKPDFYKEFYDWGVKFPVPIGFKDHVGFISGSILSVGDLIPSLLKNYFLRSELIYGYPITIPQLITMREKVSATLYCITVTDDLDPKISETTKIDKENIRDFFGTAANAINLNIKNISIQGSRFNLSSVESIIRSLKVKANDIIVFSYSGHGFSYSNDPLYRFPQLALWHGQKNAAFFRKNSINLQTIFDRLRAKGARLTIVLGDCCNTDAGITREIDEPPPISAMMGPMPPYLRRNYLRLLMETEGAYIACAAQKGEPAAGDIYKGGFFTFNFTSIIKRRVLNEAEIDPATIWYSVLESTSNAAARDASSLFCREFNGPCRQTSVYKKVSSKSIKAKR